MSGLEYAGTALNPKTGEAYPWYSKIGGSKGKLDLKHRKALSRSRQRMTSMPGCTIVFFHGPGGKVVPVQRCKGRTKKICRAKSGRFKSCRR